MILCLLFQSRQAWGYSSTGFLMDTALGIPQPGAFLDDIARRGKPWYDVGMAWAGKNLLPGCH
jgi:hypothetical protein